MANNLQSLHNDSYVRPKYTTQDKLTDDDIDTLLEDYIEVDDIRTVEYDTHLRYFTVQVDNGVATKVFRFGGNLKYLSKDNAYVMLSNGDKKWSVQVENSIFYKQLSIMELKQEYEEIIDEYENEILELKHINRKLYKKLTGDGKEMHKKDKKKDKQKISANREKRSDHQKISNRQRVSDKCPAKVSRNAYKKGPTKKELSDRHHSDMYTSEKHIRL